MRRRVNNDFAEIRTYLIAGKIPESVNPFVALDFGTATTADKAFAVYQQICETLPKDAAGHRIYRGKSQ